jgi:hypothetical protein
MTQLTWATTLLFVFSHVVGMTDILYHAQSLVDIGSHELFAQAGVKLWFPQSLLPKNVECRITGVSYMPARISYIQTHILSVSYSYLTTSLFLNYLEFTFLCHLSFFFLSFFCTQSLSLARQVFYFLNHTTSSKFWLISFCGAMVWTQGFVLTKEVQVLYCLSHTFSPFYCGYFGNWVSWTICPSWPQTAIFSILDSQVARTVGLSHRCQANVFLTVCKQQN